VVRGGEDAEYGFSQGDRWCESVNVRVLVTVGAEMNKILSCMTLLPYRETPRKNGQCLSSLKNRTEEKHLKA
jgi:hypothetical protein